MQASLTTPRLVSEKKEKTQTLMVYRRGLLSSSPMQSLRFFRSQCPESSLERPSAGSESKSHTTSQPYPQHFAEQRGKRRIKTLLNPRNITLRKTMSAISQRELTKITRQASQRNGNIAGGSDACAKGGGDVQATPRHREKRATAKP